MKVQGDSFKYFFNNESKTREEIEQLIDYDTTVSLDGFNINYSSPKKKVKIQEDTDIENFVESNKIQEILKEAKEYQKQNGGILKGVEFPFDGVLTFDDKIKNSTFINLKYKSTLENKVIEDWNRKEFYIISPSKENLDRMCESFEQRVKNNSNKCGIVGKKETENKVDYSEINFKLIDLMAKRFNDNKHKYPKGNTLKVIDKNLILWAAFRHIRKMIQPIENDNETYEDHLAAVATNMSIILDQLDNEQRLCHI